MRWRVEVGYSPRGLRVGHPKNHGQPGGWDDSYTTGGWAVWARCDATRQELNLRRFDDGEVSWFDKEEHIFEPPPSTPLAEKMVARLVQAMTLGETAAYEEWDL